MLLLRTESAWYQSVPNSSPIRLFPLTEFHNDALTVEECLKWTTQRKVFGKPLHSQAVIRSKLAGMISRAEAVQSWLENITYQMCNMSYKQQAGKLAG